MKAPKVGEVAATYEDPASLVVWSGNPRLTKKAVDHVARSIERFGFGAPVLARKSNREIIAGHTRVAAAIKLKIAAVPVRFLDMPAKLAHALALVDNKTGELSGWDDKLLRAALRDVDGAELAGIGFSEVELARYLAEPEVGGSGERDAVPPTPKRAITKLGDVWQLGDHRLVCGDCTDPAVAARLMAGQKGGLFATDPPYGVAYDVASSNHRRGNRRSGGRVEKAHDYGAGGADIDNDELDGPKLQAFLESAFAAWTPHLEERVAWYVWHAQLEASAFTMAAMRTYGVRVHRQIVWVKGHYAVGRGDFHWQHEVCSYGWRSGGRPKFHGGRSQSTVWVVNYDNDQRVRNGANAAYTCLHPTQKPVEIFVRSFRFSTEKGAIGIDPFAGSGSQIIAAEETERRCYAAELLSVYCDVIVERWQQRTGGKAKRLKAAA